MAILPQVLNTLPAGVVRAGIQRYFFFLFFGQLADWWRLDLTYLAATGNRSGRLLLPPGVCEELFGSDFNCCRDTQSRICFQSLFFFFLFLFFFVPPRLEKCSEDFLFRRRLIFTSATQLSRGRRGRCDTTLRQRRGGGPSPRVPGVEALIKTSV